MKISSSKFQMWSLLALLLVLVVAAGCQTTPDTVAFKVAKGTQLTVEEALGVWDLYIEQKAATGNPVRLADEKLVKNAFEKYQKAALVMADAGRAWTQARNLPAVPGGNSPDSAKALFDLSVRNLDESKADLFGLLETLGIKTTK